MRVRIFSSKDGANFVNALKIRSNCHLLRELGRLSEERGTSEIVQLENTGARFRGSTLSRSVSVEKSWQIRQTCNFGVWISTNRRSSRAARKALPVADWMRKIAWEVAVRRSIIRFDSLVLSEIWLCRPSCILSSSWYAISASKTENGTIIHQYICLDIRIHRRTRLFSSSYEMHICHLYLEIVY